MICNRKTLGVKNILISETNQKSTKLNFCFFELFFFWFSLLFFFPNIFNPRLFGSADTKGRLMSSKLELSPCIGGLTLFKHAMHDRHGEGLFLNFHNDM